MVLFGATLSAFPWMVKLISTPCVRMGVSATAAHSLRHESYEKPSQLIWSEVISERNLIPLVVTRFTDIPELFQV
ncbi:hypothetical protein AVO44_09295 [Ruegeria profundi]|uniref:Uncharacterized protein n=1 Tax=Ruegeria profundi TaxID=1685378 RepID=A0A0X3TXV4_9RHOB|nr:hypothetical protein AVO44_09295 [Ruegeria profundi]